MATFVMIISGLMVLGCVALVVLLPIFALLAMIVPKKFRFGLTRKKACLRLFVAWVLNFLLMGGLYAFSTTELGQSIKTEYDQQQTKVKEQAKQKEEKERLDKEAKEKERKLAEYEAEYKVKNTMTLEKYNSIKMGMAAKQVYEIVGGFGEVLSQNKVAGHETVVLKYNGNGSLGSNANITIQDDKVVGKAQVGLK